MTTQIDRDHGPDAILPAGESDGAFAAWTLEELDLDDLGSVRSAFAGSDDAGA